MAAIALALVVVAIAIALRAAREARAAKAEIELLRRNVAAENRPLIQAAGDPPAVSLEGDRVHVSVPLRNAGTGVAAIDDERIELEGNALGAIERSAVEPNHVPAEGTTTVEVVAAYLPDGGGRVWRLVVPYADPAGEQRTLARFELVRLSEDVSGEWAVESLPSETVAGGRSARAPREDPGLVDVWGQPMRPHHR